MFAARAYCLILLSVVASRHCSADETAVGTTSHPSLAFELKTLDGEAVDVSATDSGVTVVCFLGTECRLVQLYSVRLSQMADQLRDRGVIHSDAQRSANRD